jgi:ribonuclease P protein component
MLLRVMAAHPALLPPPECHRPSAWRGAVVVSGKVSKRAVVRNRLRRLLHRHLLSLDPTPLQPSWVVLSLKPGSAELDPAQLLGECSYLLRQAGLTK